MSFPIAHFPDAHFPDAHFPHDEPEGGGLAVIFSNDVLLLEDADMMYRLVTPMEVTKSDTNLTNAVLPDGTNPEFLYVGTSGAVAMLLADGTTKTFPGVAAGGFLWMPTYLAVLDTGTTATGILATRRF